MPELTDGVLTLRPLTGADRATVLEEHNNAESRRWAFTDAILSERSRRTDGRASRVPLGRRTGRAVCHGGCRLPSPGRADRGTRIGPPDVGLLGYGVLPAWRGRGLTSRALELLAGWVFATTSISRLELGHKAGNVASGRAALRAGWVMEGRHARRLRNADGTLSDEVCYGRTRPLP